MGVVPPSPSSELGKELRKWEQHHTVYALDEDGNSAPGNPYVFREYPKMLYRAELVNGKATVLQGMPEWSSAFPDERSYDRALLEAEQHNKRRQKIVRSELEEAIATGQGWRPSQQAALDLLEQTQVAIGNASAQEHFAVAKMSEQAQREWQDAGEVTHEHVVDLRPKKRGRKPKVVAGSGPVED